MASDNEKSRTGSTVSGCGDEHVVKAGWLNKRGHFRRNWKQRYFEVTRNHMRYYTDESKVKELGSAALLGGEVLEASPDSCSKFPGAFMLRVAPGIGKNSHPKYELAADDEEESTRWQNVLSGIVGAPVKREGYLIKQGKTVKAWRRRYFRIRGGAMLYYLSETCTDPQGSAPLAHATAFAVEDDPAFADQHNVFCVRAVTGRDYYLSAADKEERDRWIQSITNEADYMNREVKTQVRRLTRFLHDAHVRDREPRERAFSSSSSSSSDDHQSTGIDAREVLHRLELDEQVNTEAAERALFVLTGGVLEKYTKEHGYGRHHARFVRMLADGSVVWDDRQYVLKSVQRDVSFNFLRKHSYTESEGESCFWITVHDPGFDLVTRNVWFRAESKEAKEKWVAGFETVLSAMNDSTNRDSCCIS